MPVVAPSAVRAELLADRRSGWRRMLRIEAVDASVRTVSDAVSELLPDRLVYAEGDSWFDKFTPIPLSGTNLLDAIRTPFHAAVVDVAHIGDEAHEMVQGRQALNTVAMFRLHDFHAILLSAGGNDLKNVFADLFAAKALARQGLAVGRWTTAELDRVPQPRTYSAFFAGVIDSMRSFVALRDASPRAQTRGAPILLHGYDYFQPRPAGAQVFAGTRIGRGPWLYPTLQAAGLDDARMRAVADAVVDELNEQLASRLATLENVHVIDQRGVLVPATFGSTDRSGDWLDEIHPHKDGFETLARQRWDAALSQLLGWQPGPGDLVPPAPPVNRSTALLDDPGRVA
jgi:hypothetical protein